MGNINTQMYVDAYKHILDARPFHKPISFPLLYNEREVSRKSNSIMNPSSECLTIYTFILYDRACFEKC